ncbi:hypothetical protein U0L90_01850 [Flavobacteriaceae sp. LMIT009]|jgi:hypothetical protein
MKTTTSNANPVSKLYCNIFGHQYDVSKNVTKHVKEYTCKCCKRQVTTDGNGRLTELTPTFKEINTILENIHTKRMLRVQQKMFATTAA